MSAPIGIFDSGVGGLTVYRALKQVLPNENYLYLGDTARLPYGTKTTDTITRYSLQAAKKLIDAGVQLLVVACNTATASSLTTLQLTYPDIPIIGVIEPGAKAALAISKSHHMAVIATAATIRSRGYEAAIHALAPEATLLSKATPLLVALAEEGLLEGKITHSIVEHYLRPWLEMADKDRPDTLILGCTHFPVLKRAIEAVVEDKMQIVDSAATVAATVKSLLRVHQTKTGHSEFWITDGVERFLDVAHIFLDTAIDPQAVHLVDLG